MTWEPKQYPEEHYRVWQAAMKRARRKTIRELTSATFMLCLIYEAAAWLLLERVL